MYRLHFKLKGVRCGILEHEDCFEYVFEEGTSIKSPKDMWYLEEFWSRIPHLVAGDLGHYCLKDGDKVIDCGAYIGIFTAYAAKRVGKTGKIIAFEPDPLNFKRLTEIIKINGLKNVIAVNKATWSSNGNMEFDYRGEGTSTLFTDKKKSPIVMNVTAVKNIITVPVVTLDDELKRLGLDRVDFIKMDIESAEIETLKGAKNILAKKGVNLAIASNHIVDGKYTKFEIERILGNMGYKVETGYPAHMTTYAWKE